MREVLVFAESTPDAQQCAWLLERLEELRRRPVVCQVHLRPVRITHHGVGPPPPVRLPAQAAPNGAGGELASADERAERDVELARARRRLHGLVELVRGAGHVAHGELLAGPLVRALTRGIAERSPDEVLLLTADHRLELLVRRDLERRGRRAAAVPVQVLAGAPGPPRA